MSPYLVDAVEIGDAFEIRGPIGGHFVWSPADKDPVLLVGGGSGLAPLASIARHHRNAGSTAPMTLVGSVRAPEDALFRAEIDTDASLTTRWTFTRRSPSDWSGWRGRLAAEHLREVIPCAQQLSAFVCGPTAFVEHVAALLVDAGITPARIRTERFGPT